MTALWIVIAVAVAVAAVVIYLTTRKKNVEESQVKNEDPIVEQLSSAVGGAIKIKSDVWYMCTRDLMPYVAGVVYLGADIDPSIKQWYKYFREATKEEIEEQHPTPAPEPTPEPEPDTDGEELMLLTEQLAVLLDQFDKVVHVYVGSVTFNHLLDVAWEAHNQYFNDKSKNGLPLFVKEENFPVVYNYWGGKKDEDAAFKTMLGWLVALQLTELSPYRRNDLLKIGYEAGGYSMKSPIYGYEFRSDPNVMRIIAGCLYSTMRATVKPNIAAMRLEVGGRMYDKTLYQLWDIEPRTHVTDDAFYIDFRKFMNSAPGPYAPGYQDRSRNNPTFPDEKTSNGCLKTDMDIHNFIVSKYNLPEQTSVQAIADKDWDNKHMFGEDKTDVHGYSFAAIFGKTTIGKILPTSGKLADFICLVKQIGGSGRGILQHADPSLGPVEYGRLRPGCSWDREACKHSNTDDTLNVSTDFWLEDGDGNPTGYYDQNGNWVYPDKVSSPKDYEEKQKNELYANSYTSGHSSGIMSGGMSLMELFPTIADIILKEIFVFSQNRSISRFHWTSDIIQGRVIGTAMNAVCHAASDYNKYIEEITKEG